MSIKKFLLALFIFNAVSCYSQFDKMTYFDVYFDGLELLSTDSTTIDIPKADSIFQALFLNGKNQIEDIDQVIGRLKKLNFPVHENYYTAQIKESKNYLNYKLQTNDSYRIKRSKYRKLNKTIERPKDIRRKKTFKLLRMLHKDQHSRKKKSIERRQEVDSLNAIEIKKMLYDTAYIKELDYLNRSFIEIIIMHGGWDNYEKEIDLIHYYVEQRYLNRSFFADIFERKALGNGTLFKITEGKLEACNECSEKLCAKSPMYPSNTGNRQYYINGQHVFVPVNPKLTIDELNLFRRYCFLPKFNTKTVNKNIIFPTIAEWCLLNNYL